MRRALRRWPVVLVLLALLAVGKGALPVGTEEGLASCREQVDSCPIETLPTVTLSESQPEIGQLALRAMKGPPTAPVIDDDEALAIAWDEDAQPTASSRQAVLGAADPDVSWAEEHPIVYVVRWFDVCVPLLGLMPDAPTPVPTCVMTEWDTVIDAFTGEFVVGGS